MDDTKKFGDFNDDDIVEYDGDIDNVDILDDLTPRDLVITLPEKDKTETKLSEAVGGLIQQFNLPLEDIKVADVLKNINQIDTDDNTFDLVASKIVTDYVGRVALKGVITEASVINKLFESLDVMINTRELDGDTLLVIDKVLSYQDKLFSILDRYQKPGAQKSLEHAAKIKRQQQTAATPFTTADVKVLIEEIQKQKKNNES